MPTISKILMIIGFVFMLSLGFDILPQNIALFVGIACFGVAALIMGFFKSKDGGAKGGGG
ncbi:MAG: hypothetical protein KDK91_12025 [Gammaproteobacteria bacterium]|nr:hypothetical protein [Gammaproteobacteria bacterium]